MVSATAHEIAPSDSGIAVVVPFFNRRNTLLATLASIEKQTLLPAQVVLVDDGSTDDGLRIALAWTDRVRGRFECSLIRQANSGPSAARNRGLQQARSCQHVAFLDSDDVWPADFLARTHAALSANPTAVAATCDRRFVYFDSTPAKSEDCSSLPRCPCVWMLENGAGIVSSSLLRHSAVARRGGFNSALVTGEDAALFMRMSLDGPWLHVPGEPVDLNCGLAQEYGDEGNLSKKHSDRQLRWVNVYEQFFSEDGARAFLDHPNCRRLMALRWYAAGKETYRNGSPHEALACFRKVLSLNPRRGRYYRWLVRAWIASMFREETGASTAFPRRVDAVQPISHPLPAAIRPSARAA
jgi:hypothetical protein